MRGAGRGVRLAARARSAEEAAQSRSGDLPACRAGAECGARLAAWGAARARGAAYRLACHAGAECGSPREKHAVPDVG
ncbi:hypothetical protein Pen01_78800 [Phytomonospora endophytica]|nr:hypothetical protein Pen01_78800 [Phytomonospora endophytica]